MRTTPGAVGKNFEEIIADDLTTPRQEFKSIQTLLDFLYTKKSSDIYLHQVKCPKLNVHLPVGSMLSQVLKRFSINEKGLLTRRIYPTLSRKK